MKDQLMPIIGELEEYVPAPKSYGLKKQGATPVDLINAERQVYWNTEPGSQLRENLVNRMEAVALQDKDTRNIKEAIDLLFDPEMTNPKVVIRSSTEAPSSTNTITIGEVHIERESDNEGALLFTGAILESDASYIAQGTASEDELFTMGNLREHSLRITNLPVTGDPIIYELPTTREGLDIFGVRALSNRQRKKIGVLARKILKAQDKQPKARGIK